MPLKKDFESTLINSNIIARAIALCSSQMTGLRASLDRALGYFLNAFGIVSKFVTVVGQFSKKKLFRNLRALLGMGSFTFFSMVGLSQSSHSNHSMDSVNSTGGDPIISDGGGALESGEDLEGEEDHFAPTEITLDGKEFDSMMAGDPVKGLNALFDKMHEADIKLKSNPKKTGDRRIFQFSLELTKTSSNPNPLQLTSVALDMNSSEEIQIKLLIPEEYSRNPIVLMEGLSRLNSMMNSRDLKLKFGSHSYKQGYKIIYDKNGHEVWEGHPDAHTTKWKHFDQWRLVHNALKMFGIRTTESLNGRSYLTAMELKANAEAGSFLAQREVAEIELNNAKAAQDSLGSYALIKNIKNDEELKRFILEAGKARGQILNPNLDSKSLWISYFQLFIDELKKDLDKKTILAKQQLKDFEKIVSDPELKMKKEKLEELPEKLDALVKKNDREGVANLLTVYLSLDTLEPFERQFWLDQIEAIRHPDFRKSVVLFRGLDNKTDKPQKALDAQGKEIGRGYFSSLLIYNQGSYTRRLRSLLTMRTRFGSEANTSLASLDQVQNSPLISTPKISVMFNNHARDAVGSPFLSFTTNPRVAITFTRSGLLAVRVDARRAIPNLASYIPEEFEVILPLIVFPDEVIHFEEGKKIVQELEEDRENSGEAFLKEVNRKLGRPENQEFWNVKIQNSYGYGQKFFQLFKRFYSKLSSIRSASNSPSNK